MKYKIGLTATPITKNVYNLFSIFKLLKKELFPLQGEFERNFVVFNRFGDAIGGKDLEALKEIIKPYTLVKNNKEIEKQLPKLTVNKIMCEASPQLKKSTTTLMKLKKDIEDEKEAISNKYRGRPDELQLLRKDEDIISCDNKTKELLLLLQQVADDPYLIETSTSQFKPQIKMTKPESPKYDLLIETLENIFLNNENEKVCIFTKFVRMQEELIRRLEAHFNIKTEDKLYTFKCAKVNGSMNSEERYHQAYDLFQEDNDYKILIATDAMNEGTSLSKCKYLIEYDLSASYAIQTQRHGRIVRANSISGASTVFQLIVKDSYDENQLKVIEKKEDVHNAFFEPEEDEEGNNE